MTVVNDLWLEHGAEVIVHLAEGESLAEAVLLATRWKANGAYSVVEVAVEPFSEEGNTFKMVCSTKDKEVLQKEITQIQNYFEGATFNIEEGVTACIDASEVLTDLECNKIELWGETETDLKGLTNQLVGGATILHYVTLKD